MEEIREDLAEGAEQDRLRQLLLAESLDGPEYPFFLAFRKHDSLGLALGLVHDRAHHLARPAQATLEDLPVVLQIEFHASHAGLHRGFRDRERLLD